MIQTVFTPCANILLTAVMCTLQTFQNFSPPPPLLKFWLGGAFWMGSFIIFIAWYTFPF